VKNSPYRVILNSFNQKQFWGTIMAEWTDVVRLKDNTNSLEYTAEQNPPAQKTLEETPPKPAGASIPGYEIIEELGRGGMGVVYKARQLSLNRLVALKVAIGGSFAGPIEKARFQMEAEAVAKLHHKNIVQVYDIGKQAGMEYIAFEFVDGPTVRRWQNGRPIDPYIAARIATDVARAVQHAHDQGIIHRDLKPANVLLDGAGVFPLPGEGGENTTIPDSRVSVRVPKVMDFGLAKAVEGGSNLTLSGVACGTPNYMAPEQVKSGPNSARPAVDVWGMGAVLFEMLTGRPPFVGWDAATIMSDILLSEPPSVRKFAPRVPRDLAIVVSKCLEKEPTRRYLSPGDMADDLDRFLEGRPIHARAINPIQRVRRWVTRNPFAAALGAVMLVSLAVVSTLAVALNQLAERERQASDRERLALLEEEKHRRDAEAATWVAEKARDDTRNALNNAEKALGTAREERDRAEKNLTMARKAVNNVLTTLSTHSENENPALVPVYQQLLTGCEPFVEEMLAQKKGDRDLRFEQALIARSRGIMEVTSGKVAAARVQMLLATSHFGALVKANPNDKGAFREFCYTLACLGAISTQLGSSDANDLLREARKTLESYLADNPRDTLVLDSLIRVRLAMTVAGGDRFSDEHNLAVLDLVERLTKITPLTPHIQTYRAHAINNIASDLTNRGKTDDAELYWLQVLAIRESLAQSLPDDKIMRYELAKCLMNYANQLVATGRASQSLKVRERTIGLFDSLHEDAKFRATYIPTMVDFDLFMAGEYAARGNTQKAITRLNKAIALNSILLERDKTVVRVRGIHADAHTRRAKLNEQNAQHAQAVRDYQIAIEFSTKQSHREYCLARLVQALVHSGDRTAATTTAMNLNPEAFSHPALCLELARSWLVLAKASKNAPHLTQEERDQTAGIALQNAKKAVQCAQKRGLFQDANQVRQFHADQEFELLWDMVPRLAG
jgi:serine/threonine protein kinase/tetratricopeptide (TPR) repeat protein